MIIFKKVRWKNFLSTGNIFIEIDLNKYPVTIITGKNGHGKSQLLDAICYGLFNKGFRNIPKGNFINSINGSDLVVEVEFSVGNKDYKVCRGTKPSFFEVYDNGVLLDQDANVRDQQSFFEKNILRLNWKAFTQVVILGSASHTPFMQLKASDRREIVEELLDLKVFSVMKVLLKDKVDTLKHEMDGINFEISTLETKIELEIDYIEKSKQDSSERIKKDKEEIEKTRSLISNEQLELEKLDKELLEKNESELKNKLSNIQKKTSELQKIEHQIQSKINSLEKEISFFGDNDTCPTCKQSITDAWREEAILQRSERIVVTKDGIDKLEDSIRKLDDDRKNIQDNIDEIEVIRRNINSHRNTISSYEKFIDKIQSSIVDSFQKESLDEQIKKLDENNKLLVTKQSKKDELVNTKDIYNVASSLLKDSGIKANVIKQYIPIINASVNKYLSHMDFFVKFTIDENFEESMRSRHIDDFKYSNFSEGEKKRIDLALMLTWRDVAKKKNSMSTNLLLLDEVFDSALDTEGSEAFAKIIKMMYDQNVIIITHKPEIADKLESDKNVLIRVEKVKNFSKIVIE